MKNYLHFLISKLVRKNSVNLELTEKMKFTLLYTWLVKSCMFHCRMMYLNKLGKNRSYLFGWKKKVVSDVLKHTEGGKGYLWFTIMKDETAQEVKWVPTRNFIDKNEKCANKFHSNMVKNNLLRQENWYGFKQEEVGLVKPNRI